MSEMCCTWLTEIQNAKITQKSPSAHQRTTLSGYISTTKAFLTIRKKLDKQQNLIHMSSQYGELRPTKGWDRLAILGHLSKFQRVSHLDFVTAPASLNRRSTKLCTMFLHFLGWYTISTFWRARAP